MRPNEVPELILVWRVFPLWVAPSLEQGSIGVVEWGGSKGPLSVMLVLGMVLETLLGFEGTPLSTIPVQSTQKKNTHRSP